MQRAIEREVAGNLAGWLIMTGTFMTLVALGLLPRLSEDRAPPAAAPAG